jgi:hypothetical protein
VAYAATTPSNAHAQLTYSPWTPDRTALAKNVGPTYLATPRATVVELSWPMQWSRNQTMCVERHDTIKHLSTVTSKRQFRSASAHCVLHFARPGIIDFEDSNQNPHNRFCRLGRLSETPALRAAWKSAEKCLTIMLIAPQDFLAVLCQLERVRETQQGEQGWKKPACDKRAMIQRLRTYLAHSTGIRE